MSSPAVVNVALRTANCKEQLRRLDRKIDLWAKDAGADERSAALARREHLQDLLEQERFNDVLQQASSELVFIEKGIKKQQKRAIARAIQQRELQRRQQENAAALLAALQTRSVTAEPEAIQNIRALAKGTAIAEAEKWLARGFALLTAPEPEAETLSDEQLRLARQLQTDEKNLTLEEWLTAHRPPRDPRLTQIDQHIAELALLQGETAIQPFLERLIAAEIEAQDAHRNLLLDSLMLNLGQASRDWRQIREQRAQLREFAGTLAEREVAGQHTGLLARIETSLSDPHPDLQQLTTLSKACQDVLITLREAENTMAYRQAILFGLSSLGYEVHEGMEALWADQGKVVLQNTATPGYGLEVGGKAANGRMQTRVVAFSGKRDKQRDRDIEVLWCNELKRLQSLLKSQGIDLTIEQERQPGEVPIKVVESKKQEEEKEVSLPQTFRIP
jgi:hypothetical protein